jgi:hypothetical protein
VLTNDIQNRQWKREECVEHVVCFEQKAAQGTSQRTFAKEHGVPRTTLQYWLERKHSIDASSEMVAFFETPSGLAFLHRLVIALQFVMGFVSGCGLRPVAMVIEMAGLSAFVANSFGSRQKLGSAMEEQIRAFAKEQREKLSAQMATKRITVCEDETFHPETCLVAIEPVSNFILLEQYAKGRDAATWTKALNEALRELPVRAIQSTSDEGKGLLAHVRAGLGAHHSPDIFHVQQELSRATSIVLAGQVRQAEQAKAKVAGDNMAEQQVLLDAARQRQERAHRAIRGISQAYHPVDLKTGALRSVEQIAKNLEDNFAEITTVAMEAALPERCSKGIEKAHRLIPALACTATFFFSEVKAQIGSLELTPEEARVVEQQLVSAAYLERAASKASPADTRPPLYNLAEQLRANAQSMLANLSPDRLANVERVACDCADIFQRSSSCVEGRNGQLSLRHHSLHRITPARLESLTAVHNYFIRRRDGTTAAERFFGAKPADLFDWLLDHLDMPTRPTKPRAQEATSRLLN